VRQFGFCLFSLTLVGALPAFAGTILDFEGFPDSTVLATQYAGLTFTNATVITAGISLDELEFPPHSGSNVVFDNGGPMSISFTAPVSSVSGYFTYAAPLSLAAFNASSDMVASGASAFSSNLALSGDPGSSPNEFLQLTFAGGISSITFAGDPAGDSFTLDDLTYSAQAAATPEPGSIGLLVTGLVGLALFRRRRIQ
jgi:hypothetical protein